MVHVLQIHVAVPGQDLCHHAIKLRFIPVSASPLAQDLVHFSSH